VHDGKTVGDRGKAGGRPRGSVTSIPRTARGEPREPLSGSVSRFLILPWVEVRNLASHVLGLSVKRIAADWEERFGVRPLLLETLVDARRFSGTCYRAANWLLVGQTTGRGRMDRAHVREGAAPKRVFVYPLVPKARELLRGSE